MRDFSENNERIKRLIIQSQDNYDLSIRQQENAKSLDEIKEEFKRSVNYETEMRNTDDILKINVLTEENKKLKEQYGELMKKTNILIDAYRKLKTENETLIKKKAKSDYWSKMISDVKKFIINIVNDIIKWFNS